MKRKIIYWSGIRAVFGLMFKRPGEYIYILDIGKEKNEIIHTFFCLEPMDIVILDENKEIVGVYLNVKPFRIIKPRKKFRYIIEGKNIVKDLDYILSSF